jgi:hypothetical protein
MRRIFQWTALMLPIIAVPVIAVPAPAQVPGRNLASVAASAPKSIARGGHGTVTLVVSITPTYHINSHKPADPSLIPTAVIPKATPGVVYGVAHFPPAKSVQVTYSKIPLLVYMGKALITLPFAVTKSAHPGSVRIGGTLDYQACDSQSCYPPSKAPFSVSVVVK